MKKIKYILPAIFMAIGTTAFVSCDDMLDMGNDDVLYTDDNTLKSANDTVNTFVGILYQLQKIGVRTNLYGELRGDLTTVYQNADVDLKAIANFDVASSNAYNNPRDYYSVINNCNFYLANADTDLSESRQRYGLTENYYVLRAEYVAVRAIRAWVYLQLGQIYHENIPIIETPITTVSELNELMQNAPRKDLAWICDHFIADLEQYKDWFDYPYHGNPKRGGYSGSTPSRMSVLPIHLVLGDLYLWASALRGNAGDQDARKAAKCYYDYIIWTPNKSASMPLNNDYKRVNITGWYRDCWYMTGNKYVEISDLITGNNRYYGIISEGTWYSTTSFGRDDSEVISAIAMDSVAAQSHFNTLRYLYSYNEEDGSTPASFGPSQPCIDYSDNQVYGDYYKAANASTADFIIREPLSIPDASRQIHFIGDMRLGANLIYSSNSSEGSKQQITKSHNTRDVIIYRTGDVYLRMAEALNHAGFPKFAKYILTTGLDNIVIDSLVLSQCQTAGDSAFIKQFRFPRSLFKTQLSEKDTKINTPVNIYYPLRETLNKGKSIESPGFNDNDYVNQIGIHQRGSGNAMENPKYYPADADVIPTNLPAGSYHNGVLCPTTPTYSFVNVSFNTNDKPETIKNAIQAANSAFIAFAVSNKGPEMDLPNLDDYPNEQQQKIAILEYYNKLRAYDYTLRWDLIEWNRRNVNLIVDRQKEVVDSLLDIESALETCFEGFRAGFLMRADYRCGGTGRKMGGGKTYAPGQYFAEHVGKRDASLQGKLMDRNNWYIGWKDEKTGATIGIQH